MISPDGELCYYIAAKEIKNPERHTPVHQHTRAVRGRAAVLLTGFLHIQEVPLCCFNIANLTVINATTERKKLNKIETFIYVWLFFSWPYFRFHKACRGQNPAPHNLLVEICRRGFEFTGCLFVTQTCRKMRPIPLSSCTLCWGSYWMMEW